jgi:hypothetical protein
VRAGLGALTAGGKTMSLGGRGAASKKLRSWNETQIKPPPIIGNSTIASLTNIKLCFRTFVSANFLTAGRVDRTLDIWANALKRYSSCGRETMANYED